MDFFQFSHTVEGESLTISVVRFNPRPSDQSKTLTCRAENTDIKGSATEDSIILTVHCKCSIQ